MFGLTCTIEFTWFFFAIWRAISDSLLRSQSVIYVSQCSVEYLSECDVCLLYCGLFQEDEVCIVLGLSAPSSRAGYAAPIPASVFIRKGVAVNVGEVGETSNTLFSVLAKFWRREVVVETIVALCLAPRMASYVLILVPDVLLNTESRRVRFCVKARGRRHKRAEYEYMDGFPCSPRWVSSRFY